MALSDSLSKQLAYDVIDLTGDSDEDDSSIIVDGSPPAQLAIKIELEEAKPSSSAISNTTVTSAAPSSNLNVPDTTQTIAQKLEHVSNEAVGVSTTSSSNDSTAPIKITAPESPQPVTNSSTADSTVESVGSIKATSDPIDIENFDSVLQQNHVSLDVNADKASANEDSHDQENLLHPEIPPLPELPEMDLPGDDDPNDLDDMDPDHAILLYVQNNLHQDNDSRQDVQSHQFPGPEDAELIDWNMEIDSDPTDGHVRAAAKFAQLKKAYHDKKANNTATGEDDIHFISAEAAETKRLGDLERSQRLTEPDPSQQRLPAGYHYGNEHEDQSIFIPETPERPVLKSPKNKQPRKPLKSQNKITAKETREAMALGNSPSAARKRANPYGRNQSTPRKKRDNKNASGKAKANGGRTRPTTLTNLGSLGPSNVVQDAQANADKPAIPMFTSKNKQKALQELIASIPSTESGSPNSDKNAVIEATKKFRGRGVVRSDGQGGWKLKGMRSSLYHHQLLGAGFLRDRENGNQRPFGGMVCDEMGFGKTIQMIANIVDGKADAGAAEKTTLVVAPASLLNQWMMELEKHVAPGYLARIIRYHSGARLLSNDPVADLREYDIILTTYSEIQKSYPACEPPKHLVTEEGKNAWWEMFYRENVGPLHRIKYLRIVLDEAHQIKNPTSKTSIAVRALTGTFRWAITGTPILNYIEELFPYFSFLKVPHTGDYPTFLHNYCHNRKGRDPVNMGRIHNILRAIMLRRTHADTMFNLPILSLPGISHTTYKIEFNDVERTIYNTVKRRFVQDINKIHRAGQLAGSYSNVLAMIHYLRMLCAHVLLCQGILKRLFNAADIELLWRLTEKESQFNPGDDQVGMISVLQKMLRSKSILVETCQSTKAPGASVEHSDDDSSEIVGTGSDFGIYFKFRKFLNDLSQGHQWAELHLRSSCAKCKLPPEDPMCTSCFHVYCRECLMTMDLDRQQNKEEKITCIECGAHFEETSPCDGLQALGYNSETVAEQIAKIKEKSMAPVKSGGGQKKNAPTGKDEEEKKEIDWIEMGRIPLSSAKLAATKAAILNWRRSCPHGKILIYTQFLDMVRLLAKMCNAEGWNHVQFTGKMSMPARDKTLRRFAEDEEIPIMICSLKAGGVGLNLTRASKVIILDLWFNSSIESQAFCRAYRIGQERKVEVVRFMIKDTIDEDLISMQDRKDVEVQGAIGSESHGSRATITQLLGLFGEVVDDEDGENEFILVEDENQYEDDARVDIGDRLPPRPF
ncbi:hypothetical protein LTR84_009830 [Exophiala bonariae]|uniref:Uncharacterized protein n=1 Tax=Exophiala bonariae TaxID=1690606 RepID=A0AAV9NJE0_9EURO|nr:hypothetical protein LTR84_009830 [Exophiala bonariae]